MRPTNFKFLFLLSFCLLLSCNDVTRKYSVSRHSAEIAAAINDLLAATPKEFSYSIADEKLYVADKIYSSPGIGDISNIQFPNYSLQESDRIVKNIKILYRCGISGGTIRKEWGLHLSSQKARMYYDFDVKDSDNKGQWFGKLSIGLKADFVDYRNECEVKYTTGDIIVYALIAA